MKFQRPHTIGNSEGDSTTPFVLHLAQDLQKLGWRVDVLAPHAPGCARKEILEGVQVERFRYLWPESLQTVCYQGGALINLRQNKSNFFKLPVLITAEWFALLYRLLFRKYDLIHSHWLLPQGFVAVLAGFLTNVPHVVTVHGGDVFGLQQALVIPFKKFVLKNAHAVTVNSSATEKAVKELTIKIKIMQRIPMGVNLPELSRTDKRVTEIRESYLYREGPLLVFVGRVVKEKGVGDLIQAVPIIAKDYPDVRAMIIGEGQDRLELESLTREMGLDDRIFFTGWVRFEDVPLYLAASDVFVGPSRQAEDGWIEAQGLTFLEAMAVGTPVVATRSGGIVDSVDHEETGLLVDERNPKQIAEAVVSLKRDKVLAQCISKNGCLHVERRFSRSNTAQKFSYLFNELY